MMVLARNIDRKTMPIMVALIRAGAVRETSASSVGQ